jgi:hypothetical protein
LGGALIVRKKLLRGFMPVDAPAANSAGYGTSLISAILVF